MDEPKETLVAEPKDLTADELIDALLSRAIITARTNFYTFVKLMAPEILPEEFIDGRHIEIICNKFQEVKESVVKGKPKRLQIFLPPGSMKSRLGNLFSAWCLGNHPNWCFLALAADESLAVDNYGRPIKDLVESNRYQAIFPETQLRKDVQAAGRWDTTKKGKLVAKGVGGSITGRRAHIAIVDDAVTEHTDASGMAYINNWYIPGLRSRLLPKGAEIVINTRWSVKDLSGYLEDLDKFSSTPWEIIKIPALLTEEARALLRRPGDPDDLYQVGTSYWPEFWPTENFLQKKANTPPAVWNALYMQNPISESGAIVKRKEFQLWQADKPPPCKYVIVSMDTAFSKKETADYSAYTVWGIFGQEVTLFDGETTQHTNCMILLAAGKGRWDFSELCNKAMELEEMFQPDFFIIENKASGQHLIPELRKRNLPIVPYTPGKGSDKFSRLQACTPYFQSSRIWVPENKFYTQEVIEEIVTFPKAPHDDYVDSTSQAILWMRDNVKIDSVGHDVSRLSVDEDDEDSYRPPAKSYWDSLFN